MRANAGHAVWSVALAALLATTGAHAGKVFAPTPVDPAVGHATEIGQWQIQASAKAQQGGAEVSTPGFPTKDWYPVSGRATVMAGLLENDVYKDVFHSDNLRAVAVPDSNQHQFVVPWWYRTQFTLAQGTKGRHTLLRSNGIIGGADVWLNGHQVAPRADLRGAYPVRVFDVTPWVRAGVNTLALRVHAADPQLDLSMGWVDWNPQPPDNNMGPWRGIDIVQTGPVDLRFPAVTSSLSLPDLAHAALTAKVDVRNLDSVPHEATLTGTVAGVALRRVVQLKPGQSETVAFSSTTDPALALNQPKVWWPIGMGAQPLYQAQFAVAVDGADSDHASTTFGIRSVRSALTKQGYRQFFINGKPVLIRGGGWAPDMFLRHDPARVATEFNYVRNLGLNTIRSEGKLEDQHFYDLADRYGILILPGWECCDKWESAAKTGGEPWNDADQKIAAESMASEARLLRNHPSVIGFLIGSDHAPPPALAAVYMKTLRDADWPNPVISDAAEEQTAQTGPSGFKMRGPYAWVPPAYWYADQLGGAFGFDSEVSAGADIPRLEDVERMLSPQERETLWKHPELRQFHAASAWSPFSSIEPFAKALAKRYGPPKSLADYVQKAQLANYDNVRAQFEAFNANMDAANPSTGVIYWMLNNAWPSLHWHLYDYYLNPAGAYFGAKKGNEPLHIQYSYDTHAIVLVNHTLTDQHGLQAHIRVRNLDGSVRYDKHLTGLDLAGNRTSRLLTLPMPSGLSGTHFVELELASAHGQPVSRNVYWLSTQPDVLDWAKSNWYLTPVTQYADLTALQSLPTATSAVRATLRREGDENVVAVTLMVPASSKAVALFQHVTLRRATHGEPVLPILWSDNDVTLWPGESLTLTARYAAQGIPAPVIELSGWNVPDQSVPVDTAQGTRH
jgi:exo-1,4-beta-D-glucosaminidase